MGNGLALLVTIIWSLVLSVPTRGSVLVTPSYGLRNITDWRSDVAGKEGYFTNTWAVEFDPRFERDVVSKIARKHGFTLLGQIGDLKGHYHLRHDDVEEFNKLHNRDKTDRLLLEKEVRWAEQQKVLHRFKRDGVPVDPKFHDMWYILNTGQTGGPAGVDINVLPVWRKGYTGKGVVISILDDGVDHTHPDLKPNYEPKASYDFNDMDPDPYPRDSDPDNCHGTRCAGEVAAAANNSVCGVGVAYHAKVGGVRMLDGKATDALEASSLSFSSQLIDIYSNCWGPKDDGKTFGKPGPLAAKSLQAGAEKGRNGKGNIFVWATGNGGLTDDDCNCDGYTTSIYTISIGCIGDHGLSAYYTELCSSTLAVTFNGGAHREREENKMITTDLKHQCTEQFKGTSSAAPLAAGVVALMLEANPNLGWRDVQHIIVRTAKLTSPVDDGWKTNGAGFHFNHKFGFGRLDADAMVEMAKVWKNMPPQRKCTGAASLQERDIPAGGALDIQIPTQACRGTGAEIAKIEHVVLTISFIHRRRGDVSILLTSPSGTKNEMLSTRRYDDSKEGLDNWGFMTVHCWGENPKGFWNLKIIDNPMDVIGERVINKDAYGTLHTDTSKQETDVEDLEEQVIDDQTRQQQARILSIKSQDPSYDFPYPPGVRRDRVKHINDTKEDSLSTASEESIVDDLYNLTESDVASTTEFVYDRSRIEDPESVSNDFSDSRPSGSGDYENFENEAYLRKTHSKISKRMLNKRLAEFDEELAKKNLVNKKTSKSTSSKSKKDATKKVQVATEVAGTQRVQVNAGYENPEIPCLSHGCSGVLLKWVLTLYGT